MKLPGKMMNAIIVILLAIAGLCLPGEASAQSGTWTTRVAMPTARGYLAVGVVNGILYAVGGINSPTVFSTVEAYDPATNTWATKASMPTARYALAVGVVNGVLYAVGGVNGGGYLATVEAYDPTTNTWTTKAPMPTPRQDLAVEVLNGILYAVGGTTTQAAQTFRRWKPTTRRPTPGRPRLRCRPRGRTSPRAW